MLWKSNTLCAGLSLPLEPPSTIFQEIGPMVWKSHAAFVWFLACCFPRL